MHVRNIRQKYLLSDKIIAEKHFTDAKQGSGVCKFSIQLNWKLVDENLLAVESSLKEIFRLNPKSIVT